MPDVSLEAFLRMRNDIVAGDDIVAEYDETASRVDELRDAGKERTATFRQLLAQKMALSSMLDRYKRYGLL